MQKRGRNRVSAYSKQTGERIRMYRKMKSMTLQQLADRIHKSRASVSKYENGEIAMDIETLGEIEGFCRSVQDSFLMFRRNRSFCRPLPQPIAV